MNLMFRKNFREGGASKSGGTGGLKTKTSNRYQTAKRSRDMGISNPDDYHFRTHIFFTAARGASGFGYQDTVEG